LYGAILGIFGVFRRVLRFAENGVDIHINSVVDELESKNNLEPYGVKANRF
jgi:hypothetical protein